MKSIKKLIPHEKDITNDSLAKGGKVKTRQENKAIGPSIGFGPSNHGAILQVALIDQEDQVDLTLNLILSDKSKVSLNCKSYNRDYKNYIFEIPELNQGEVVKYFFTIGNDMAKFVNLDQSNMYFIVPYRNLSQKIVTYSCNGIIEAKEKGLDASSMWRMLKDDINRSEDAFILQSGDQVYNDRIEKDAIKLLRKKGDKALPEVRRMIIENYYLYRGDKTIKSINASMFVMNIWDDHDITDGFGGRKEMFDKNKNLKPEWKLFFQVCREAFQQYQGCVNPPKLENGYESFKFDFGETRVLALDLRSNKNSLQERIVSKEHWDLVLDTIRTTSSNTKQFLLVLPVVAVRGDLKLEDKLTKFFKSFFHIRKVIKYFKYTPVGPLVSKLVDMLGAYDLADDLEDCLSSSVNRKFLLSLISALKDLEDRGIDTAIVSGDIHCGGQSEIFVEDGKSKAVISQIVSSPIAYPPMPKVVRTATSDEDEIVLSNEEGMKVYARNQSYRSQRNYAKIGFHQDHGVIATWRFEGLTDSYTMYPSQESYKKTIVQKKPHKSEKEVELGLS